MESGSNKCLAVVERSELGKNLYRLLLSPPQTDFSLLFCSRWLELKELLNKKMVLDGLLINSNVLGKEVDLFLGWLQEDPKTKQTPKLFLCDTEEKLLRRRLARLPGAKVLLKPFHPTEFYQQIGGWV